MPENNDMNHNSKPDAGQNDTSNDQEMRELSREFDQLVHQNDQSSSTASSEPAKSTEEPHAIPHSVLQAQGAGQKTSENLNKYFLYTLVGGLIISALISIVAVLAGGFNETLGKALATTGSMVIHTLIILAIISLSRNRKGSVITNTLLLVSIASFATTVLQTWNVIDGSIAANAYQLYFYTFFASLWIQLLLIIGKNLLDKPTRITSQVAIAATGLFWLLLIPTIFVEYPNTLPEVYYRIIAAVGIILATASVLTTVFHRIFIFKHPEAKSAHPTAMDNMDIILAVVALFVGAPVILALVSLTQYQAATQSNNDYSSSQTYDYEKEEKDRMAKEKAAEEAEFGVDCSTMPKYADLKLSRDKNDKQTVTLNDPGMENLGVESDWTGKSQIIAYLFFRTLDDQCTEIEASTLKRDDKVVLYYNDEGRLRAVQKLPVQ